MWNTHILQESPCHLPQQQGFDAHINSTHDTHDLVKTSSCPASQGTTRPVEHYECQSCHCRLCSWSQCAKSCKTSALTWRSNFCRNGDESREEETKGDSLDNLHWQHLHFGHGIYTIIMIPMILVLMTAMIGVYNLFVICPNFFILILGLAR